MVWEWRNLRIQGEGILSQVRYTEEGRRLRVSQLGAPIGLVADHLAWAWYAMVAYRLPWLSIFDRLMLGFDADACGRYWVDRRIRGQGLPPRVAPTTAVLRAAVAKLPGAISYLRTDQLDTSVRALRIDGVPHTALEYLLK